MPDAPRLPDCSPAALLAAARRAASIVGDFYAGLDDRRVAPTVTPKRAAALFDGTIGDTGTGVDALLAHVERHVVDSCMGVPHPLYLGLVNSSPLPAAFVADYLVSAVNNNNGAWQQSPAFTAAETEVIRVFRSLAGMPEGSRGMVLPGGTYATLQALILARDARLPAWRTEGPQTLPGPPRLYTADSSHFSVTRAAAAIGLGERDVVALPSRGRGEIDVAALETRIERDRAEGALPFAVVATVGTTGTGAIDAIGPIVDLARAHDLWLHVDACYGGAVLLLDAFRTRLGGLGAVDSIVIDPQKWFFIPITAAVLMTRDADHEVDVFDVPASYIPSQGGVDAYRRGFPTSRRCAGFTIWFALRAHGLATIRAAVERNIHLTRRLEQRLAAAGFRILPGGELSIACARWEPAGVPERDQLQAAIAEHVVRSGRAWFATVRHADETWLRFNMVNLHTRERHLDTLVEAVLAAAREVEAAARRV